MYTAPLSPQTARHLFRSLLPLFAGYWQEARAVAGEDSYWKDYAHLLHTCQDVLDHAPMHLNEAKQLNVEHHLEKALECLATALNSIMPGGLSELEAYIVTDLVEHR